MRRLTVGLALAASLAWPVAAQDTAGGGDATDARSALQQLQVLLSDMGRSVGQDVPDIGPVLGPLVDRAFAVTPGPDGGQWGWSIFWDIEDTVTNGQSLERKEDWVPVFSNAAECQARYRAPVLHFERVEVPAGRGHHCVTAQVSPDDPTAWVLRATWVVEAPNRRLGLRLGAAATVSDYADPATVVAGIGEPQVPALVALSGEIGRLSATLLAPDAAGEGH